jgi:hypothetical protein
MTAPALAFTLAAIAAGLLLLGRVAHARFGAALGSGVLVLVALATPLADVAARARAADAAAFALAAAALWLRGRAAPPALAQAGAIGAAAGLAAGLHWPNAALVLLALWPPVRMRAAAVAALAGAGACVVVAAAGLAPPAALAAPHLALALFGSRDGLLFLTPILWLGIAGLAAESRRAPAVPAAAALLLGLHALAPAAAEAPRERLAALLPLLAVGLGAALQWTWRAVRRAPRSPVYAAALVLVCWNLLLVQQYASGMVPRDAPVSFARVARNGAALLARPLGAPVAWPANWLFAARHGVGPERFDAAAGKRLPRGRDGAAVIDVGRLEVDGALLLEGWSVRHPCGGAVCRAVEARARVLVPDAGRAALRLTVRASGQGGLAVEGASGVAALGAAAADLAFELPRGPAGPRAVTLAVTPGGRALVDRIEARPGADAP